jgi:thymidylate synthase (FAD)
MKITVVAHTKFVAENAFDVTGWEAESWNDEDASQLSEFAGRACYASWMKPNPKTATNAGYLANITHHQHWSVFEHGSVSLYLQKVSRSFTHELVRHRHFSYSQLSQRYARLGLDVKPVVPPLLRDDEEATRILMKMWEESLSTYAALMSHLEFLWQGSTTIGKKQIAEAARAVLPNMTPTEIVVTGNHNAWRHFFDKRGAMAADAEMREVAVAIFEIITELEPNLYQDMRVVHTDAGVPYIAKVPYVG